MVAVVGVLAVAVCILVFLYLPSRSTQYERGTATTTATTTNTNEQTKDAQWQTYTDRTYQFSIDYPSDWKIARDDLAGSPRITFYNPKQTGGATPPFTHHNDSAVHVSIFPSGLPTEGVSGETVTTTVSTMVTVDRGIDFILKDKTPWATMLTFKNPPSSWGGGFVWAVAVVKSLDTTCLRGEQFIPYEQCDVLTGDLYIRDGTVDESIRATEVRMLESFRFTR